MNMTIKMENSNIYYYTSGGEVVLLELEKFLEIITKQHVTESPSQSYIYNTGFPALVGPGAVEDSTITAASYSYKTIKLGNELTRLNILCDLLDCCTPFEAVGESFEEKLEHTSVESLMNFGEPRYLVKLTDTLYGLFCKDEVQRLVSSSGGSALICTNPGRNFIFAHGK
jgi:hypothetical protein